MAIKREVLVLFQDPEDPTRGIYILKPVVVRAGGKLHPAPEAPQKPRKTYRRRKRG